VKAVQREMEAWYLKVPYTTPAFRAAFADVILGLDCYRMNRQIMNPAMMRGLAESVEKLRDAAAFYQSGQSVEISTPLVADATA
jgi:hypothetical protein